DQGELAVALRAHDDLQQLLVEGYVAVLRCAAHWSLLITLSTSSRIRSMVAASEPSALSRSSGSVFEARTLNHQSSCETVSPSRWSMATPDAADHSRSSVARTADWSSTVELISPEEANRTY